MELIPILSTIILVATISTFLLAIGAYILYKIREGRVKVTHHKEPEYIEAEYFVPKEKKEHKIFVEEVIKPKTNYGIKEDVNEALKDNGEKKLQSKFRVIDDFTKETQTETNKIPEVELPKQKFERFTFDPGKLSSAGSLNEEIKWR
jgi:hypothetical protein